MTFGLRSVRDKALTYFDEVIDEQDVACPIDVVIQKKDEHKDIERRFAREDLRKYSKWWQKKSPAD